MRFVRMSTVFLVASLIGVGWVVDNFLLPGQGPVIDEWQTQNSKFSIRVQRRTDLYGIMTYWYVFQCAQQGSIRWQEITRKLYGEPVPLPTKQIRFVGEDVGYLFFQLRFAVTVDAGQTWSVFDFGKNPFFDPEKLGYSRITDIEILPDGTGKLTMVRYGLTQGQSTLFSTEDYGQHWALISNPEERDTSP